MHHHPNRTPLAIYVVCTDGRCRHHEPFSDKASADRSAHWGHACLTRHWLAYGTFDDAEVSLMVDRLDSAGLDLAAVRALTVTERDDLLGVAGRGDSQDNHWSAALDRIAWLTDRADD